jgi:hypothetical protein
MTAYKLLKGNEQVVSTRILGQCAPSTHCVGGTTTLRLWLARLLVNLCTLCSASGEQAPQVVEAAAAGKPACVKQGTQLGSAL